MPPPPLRPTRARENRTRYVVLGMLTYGPATAYAIKRLIGQSVGHFWQESFGQLYPALKELQTEGLVERVPESGAARGTGRPGSTYAITPAGREVLRAWLALPPVPEPHRSELLLKLFFAGVVPPETTLRHLTEIEAHLRAERAQFQAVADHWEELTGGYQDAPYWRLTLDFGTSVTDCVLRWLEGARALLQGAAPRSPGAPRSPRHRSTPESADPGHRVSTKGGRR